MKKTALPSDENLAGWEDSSMTDPLIDKINKNLEALETSLAIPNDSEEINPEIASKKKIGPDDEEEEVELIFKEDLGCYYDPKTNQYFDIKP